MKRQLIDMILSCCEGCPIYDDHFDGTCNYTGIHNPSIENDCPLQEVKE